MTQVGAKDFYIEENFLFENSCISSFHTAKLSKQDRQSTYNVNSEAHSFNHCSSGKYISITYSMFVFVALSIQRAMRMHHIISSSGACLALQYFSTCSHEWHDFREKVTGYKMCVLIFSKSN